MQINEIQPFVNSIYEIDNLGANLGILRSYVDNLKSNISVWSNRSTGGKQTFNQTTFPFELSELVSKIDPIAREIIMSWGIAEPIYLARYWFNLDVNNTSGISHCHYGSLLSGVFYITVPQGSGEIVFERPDAQEHYFKVGNTANPYTYQYYPIPPKENKLLLFPSFIKHRVNLHQFNDPNLERISISFDYQYKF
jgi:uncharacterized protein (TIGR02466 family)